MQTRHSHTLMERLEQIYFRGYCEIRTSEIMKWYERDRIGPAIWRDIQERWDTIQEEFRLKEKDQTEVFVADGDAEYVFIWGHGLTFVEPAEKDTIFFRPLTYYTRESKTD